MRGRLSGMCGYRLIPRTHRMNSRTVSESNRDSRDQQTLLIIGLGCGSHVGLAAGALLVLDDGRGAAVGVVGADAAVGRVELVARLALLALVVAAVGAALLLAVRAGAVALGDVVRHAAAGAAAAGRVVLRVVHRGLDRTAEDRKDAAALAQHGNPSPEVEPLVSRTPSLPSLQFRKRPDPQVCSAYSCLLDKLPHMFTLSSATLF